MLLNCNNLFFVFFFNSNKDSCATAKCGPQKHCVMRQNDAKCVCSLKCNKNKRKPEQKQEQKQQQHLKRYRPHKLNHLSSKRSDNIHNIQSRKIRNRPIMSKIIQPGAHSINDTFIHTSLSNNSHSHSIRKQTAQFKLMSNDRTIQQNRQWDDEIRSGFYGHDIPYPPIDSLVKNLTIFLSIFFSYSVLTIYLFPFFLNFLYALLLIIFVFFYAVR